ncbi:transposase, partial [Bifidobacterium subtile]
MRTRSGRARKCPLCGGPMQKYGRAASGRQRWRCRACKLSMVAGNGGAGGCASWSRSSPGCGAGVRR